MVQILNTVLPAAGALAAVLALILLAGRAARLTGFARAAFPRCGAGSQRLVLQDTLALDRARRLHVIRCDGQDVLVLTGGSTDVLIGWLPENQGVA